MASAPSRKRSQTQLTLFDCQSSRDKRSKLADKQDCDQHNESLDHDGCSSWQDIFSSSDNELSGTEEDRCQIIDTPQSKYDQDNTINIDKPSGSTMIIIKSSSPSTLHPFTHSATATRTDFPSDNAQGPLQSPVQPRMKFPSTTVGN